MIETVSVSLTQAEIEAIKILVEDQIDEDIAPEEKEELLVKLNQALTQFPH